MTRLADVASMSITDATALVITIGLVIYMLFGRKYEPVRVDDDAQEPGSGLKNFMCRKWNAVKGCVEKVRARDYTWDEAEGFRLRAEDMAWMVDRWIEKHEELDQKYRALLKERDGLVEDLAHSSRNLESAQRMIEMMHEARQCQQAQDEERVSETRQRDTGRVPHGYVESA